MVRQSQMQFWRVVFLTLAVLPLSAWSASIIVPGRGIDDVQIGETAPKGMQCGKNRQMEIHCEDGVVTRIRVLSKEYFVSRSKLHVGSAIGEVISFYGRGETETRSARVLAIRYPGQGIDFEVSRQDNRVISITVYRVEVREPPSKYEQYKRLFNQQQKR